MSERASAAIPVCLNRDFLIIAVCCVVRSMRCGTRSTVALALSGFYMPLLLFALLLVVAVVDWAAR